MESIPESLELAGPYSKESKPGGADVLFNIDPPEIERAGRGVTPCIPLKGWRDDEPVGNQPRAAPDVVMVKVETGYMSAEQVRDTPVDDGFKATADVGNVTPIGAWPRVTLGKPEGTTEKGWESAGQVADPST